MLGRLDQADPKALLLGDLGEAIEEDRLAGAAEPDQEQALARPARDRSAEGNAETVDELVAAGEGRGRRAGAGPVRIGELIHRVQPSMRSTHLIEVYQTYELSYQRAVNNSQIGHFGTTLN